MLTTVQMYLKIESEAPAGVFGMEHTTLHMEMLITDLVRDWKVQAKAEGVQDDSLVSRHKLTPPGADFGGPKQ